MNLSEYFNVYIHYKHIYTQIYINVERDVYSYKHIYHHG